VLELYKGVADADDAVRRYMGLLSALDLLALARSHGAVDADITDDYVQSLMHESTVTEKFLREFQQCCGNEKAYEHLRQMLIEVGKKEKFKFPERING
jgi:hypothetical protein